jgi:hypothetical protein
MRWNRVASALIAILLGSGCAFRMGDFALISSQNVGLRPEPIRKGVEGKDCVYMLLFIPIGGLVPNVEEAMDRAMEQVPEGNVMMNVAIYNDVIFTYVLNRTCARVRGEVGILK